MTESFDLVVIGGGPAGSTLATFVAMRGYRVLMLERERMPRYSIGESLLPFTLRVCRMLGVAESLERAGFREKTGGVWQWGRSGNNLEVDFTSIVPTPLIGNAYSYQVERMKFDEILFDNARRHGVTALERCRVNDVVEENGRVVAVRYVDESGGRHVVRTKWVADTSGHAGDFYQLCGERVFADRFRNIALFCYYDGGERLPWPQSNSTFSVSFSHGWFWYIPLSETLTSVGVVLPIECAGLVRGDAEAAMRTLVGECPAIANLLRDASRVTTGPYGKFRVRRDWSYCNTRFYRPGMLLAGDAACFVDPLFSTGVHLATYSALLGARSINSILAGEVDEESALAEFERRYRREYLNFYRFLSLFYDTNRTHDEYFARAHQILRTKGGRRAAFVRLVTGWAAEDGADSGSPARYASHAAGADVSQRGLSFTDALGGNGGFGVTDQPSDSQGECRRSLKPAADGLSWIRDLAAEVG